MDNYQMIAGIDDATKCPCIGSIFLAGAVADETTIHSWQEIGVKDSKLIARKKREELAGIIKATSRAYHVDQITPSMIDDKSFNLNEWEMLIVFRIIEALSICEPQHIYIDNWETSQIGFNKRYQFLMSDAAQFRRAEKNIILQPSLLAQAPVIAEHRADENYTIVGAASILAKTASDEQYDHYKKEYGDFGSGSPADPKTRHFVWQHRHNPPPLIRTSWHTYKTLSLLSRIEDDHLYKPKNYALTERL